MSSAPHSDHSAGGLDAGARAHPASDGYHARWQGGSPSDRLFIFAVALKGLDGVLEIVGALLLLAVRPSMLNAIVVLMTEHELAGVRGDFLFHELRVWFEDLTPGSLRFAVAYLLIHGAIKLLLAVSLLGGRRWAYPVGSMFLAIFIAYTLYRMSLSWSWVLFAFAVFDAITLVLVLREWAIARRREAAGRMMPGGLSASGVQPPL